MFRSLLLVMAFLALSGCQPPTLANTAEYDTAHNEASAIQAAQIETDKISDQCRAEFKNRIIKTYYAKNKCQTDALVKYMRPFANDPMAFDTYITKRLLLAIRMDKKEVTPEEGGLLGQELFEKYRDAENVADAKINARNAA